jgi:hypothetical protein
MKKKKTYGGHQVPFKLTMRKKRTWWQPSMLLIHKEQMRKKVDDGKIKHMVVAKCLSHQ